MRSFHLADELFLIGHDEYTGKAAINDEVLSSGLAGAVLGELLLKGRATCIEGTVTVLDPRPWNEPVSDAVLAEILRRGGAYVVRAWVEHLRGEVREVIGRRLIAAGLIRREEVRTLARRTQIRYPGIDPIVCTEPQVKLTYVLGRSEWIDVQTATLGALVLATGLDHLIVTGESRQEVREHLGHLNERLPPVLQALAAGVKSAIAAVALTVRR